MGWLKANDRTVRFILLLAATLIFAAASSVIAKLGEIGAHNLIEGRNPISFCNVLFVANIIASIAVALTTKLYAEHKAKRVSALRFR